ncbi:hypothetical protein GOP47_0011515 [Adiantum capillus-veneris]|uniref:Mitochondrial import inner membrane translocase subunit Tim21 n=1 Tax=Adiantum capillus-veneris TaxID=13818 RepID=A0A9D4UTE3_ADICA|nr:hypothetical protein GOP47_0011515 [Adiantum capillus-veneris]
MTSRPPHHQQWATVGLGCDGVKTVAASQRFSTRCCSKATSASSSSSLPVCPCVLLSQFKRLPQAEILLRRLQTQPRALKTQGARRTSIVQQTLSIMLQGRTIRRLGHNVLAAGQRAAARSQAGVTGKGAGTFLPRQIQDARSTDSLASRYKAPFTPMRLHAATFSTERRKEETTRRDLTAQDEDPFDPLTDKIPEKPVSFAEGASYSVAILAGFAVAAAAAYAVFKELIFEPKEYKVFNKALDRVQHDNQVTVRIGLPVTGYGQDSRNRAARQRIPHRTWADEDGVERIEVQFYVRGPHGVGRVHSEMFKDKEDKQWKFTYLIVDILSPSPTRLMLESYVPA